MIPTIASTLKLDIRVYTLNTKKGKDRPVLLYPPRSDGFAFEGNPGNQELKSEATKPILLHFEQPVKSKHNNKGHYCLINTLMGYGQYVVCPKCDKKFMKSSSNQHRDYKIHMNRHVKEIPTAKRVDQ